MKVTFIMIVMEVLVFTGGQALIFTWVGLLMV